MDRETLQKRLAELEKAMQQCMANFNMIEGGIAECNYWLKQLDKDNGIQPVPV